MKFYCIFFLFFFTNAFFNVFSQNQQAIEITNNHNAKYKEVEGTHIEIMLPSEYENSSNFLGFFNSNNNGAIVVSEFQSEVYKNFLTLNKKKLLETGLLLEKEKFYKINNFDALLVEGRQRSKYGDYVKFVLMIGNMQTTVLINASIPYSVTKENIENLRNSVLSVIFNPEHKFESKIFDFFSIDTTGTNLKFANSISNTLILTEDGIAPTQSSNKTTLIIRKIELPLELNEEQQITFVKKIIDENPIKPENNYKIEKITINEKQAYQYYYQSAIPEIYAIEVVFFTMIFDKYNCYSIMGNCIGNHETILNSFLKITNSLKIK